MVRFSKIFFLIIAGLLVLSLGYFFLGFPRVDKHTQYGITWSAPYARFLGINSQEGLRAALETFHPTSVRLPAYWSLIEPTQGRFDVKELVSQLELVHVHGATAIVVLGAKQPRWPECWAPDWIQTLPIIERQAAQLDYIKEVMQQLEYHPAIEAWQVENEPGFEFGNCLDQDKQFIAQEMEFVKKMDPHRPVYTTHSGELSWWIDYAGVVDGVGVSVYRKILRENGDPFRYTFLTPTFFKRKANLASLFVHTVYVSEFQMEPWLHTSVIEEPVDVQMAEFSLSDMQQNFHFAEHMHMPRIYFWGAEWWYWMKTKKQHPEFWDRAKQFFLFDNASD